MIKTDEFGGVTIGGTLDSLFAEYASAGKGIAKGAIDMGCDETLLRVAFELCFSRVMEVLEEEDK